MTLNWQIGDRIQNRWDIHDILGGPGKSGMGIVYKVYDREFQEVFAAKTFQDEVFARSSAAPERFSEEARIWINLDAHPNVTEARFVQTFAGKPFLFLEWVSGGDLSGWIDTPRLSEDFPQVLRFAVQFCDGMMHALSKGVTAHRDIKPQNCMITQDRMLKITDFGLAKVFDDSGSSERERANPKCLSIGLSRTGVAAGTCTHMAPEQFDDAKHVDVRADIYSFGVMLYQMITGKLPFDGRTRLEYERLHKRERVPSLEQHSPELSGLVQQCLAKNPASRYGHFTDVRAELSMIYEHLTGAAIEQPVKLTALDVAQWVNKGVSLDELGRHEEALVCFERALEFNPRLAQVWTNKGNAQGRLGRYKEALSCQDEALTLDPGSDRAWSNKGLWLDKLGRYEEALACHDKALALNPRNAMSWYNKGNALGESGLYKEALACCARALALDPRFELAWMNKGLALSRLGRPEEALACYDSALALNPHLAAAWMNKAVTLVRSTRLREALTCFQQAHRLGWPQAEQGIALCKRTLDQHL